MRKLFPKAKTGLIFSGLGPDGPWQFIQEGKHRLYYLFAIGEGQKTFHGTFKSIGSMQTYARLHRHDPFTANGASIK